MAGKAPVMCSRAMYLALDRLTKNQLIDLAVRLIEEPDAELRASRIRKFVSDPVIIERLQREMNAVWAARKDKSMSLSDAYERSSTYLRQLEIQKSLAAK